MNAPRPLNFRHDQAWGELLLDWWRELAQDTGGRASLRRAPDLTAVVVQPAFQRLHRRLLAAGWPEGTWQGDRLAAAAGLLAHVREADGLRLPKAMSVPKGDKACVSDLRFKRLLESPDVESLFVGLRRALPLIQHRCDPVQLAHDVVNWGDRIRKDWAYAYAWPTDKPKA
jgi:CRISPR system Cascade subunit CasB